MAASLLKFGNLVKVAAGSYFVPMRAVGIKIFKNKLSEYVRLAAAGETVLISDRDRVVAQLGPPDAGRTGRLPMLFWPMRSARGWSRLRRCRRASRLRRRQA